MAIRGYWDHPSGSLPLSGAELVLIDQAGQSVIVPASAFMFVPTVESPLAYDSMTQTLSLVDGTVNRQTLQWNQSLGLWQIVSPSINLASEVTGDLPFSNIAQIATAQFLGRNTSGTGDIEQLSMTTAKTMLGYQYGQETNEVTISQSVSGSSTYTQNISLSNRDWTNGVMVVKDQSSGSQSFAIVHFTDTVAQSAGMSGACTYSSYIGNNAQVGGGLNGVDGRVTANNAFLGAANTFPGTTQISSVRINGSNLEIIWRNNSVSTRTVSAKIRYYLMRGDKVTA